MSANGYLTPSELTAVDNGQYLAPTAARAWLLMRTTALADGVRLICNEGYRSYARQVYYRELYLAGQGNPAGIPGTSKHGLGLAVDVDNCGTGSPAFAWLTANAHKFGFTWTQGRADGEPWHWVFDAPPTQLAGLITATTQEEEKMDVKQIHVKVGNVTHRALVVLGTGYFVPWTEDGTAAIANSLSTGFGTGPSIDVKTKSMYDALAAGAARLQETSA